MPVGDAHASQQTVNQGRQVSVRFTYADATARNSDTRTDGPAAMAAQALAANDIGSIALQLDDPLHFYILIDDTGPTWLQFPGTGGGGAGHLESWSWTFDASTVDADPGAGNFRINAGATQLFISDDATNGATQTAPLLRFHKGQHLTIQEIATAANFQVFEVTGDPIAATGYVKLPVTVIDSGAALTANLCGIATQYSDIVQGSIGLVRTVTDALPTSPAQVVYDTALVQNTNWFTFAAGQVTIVKPARFQLSAEFTADITSGAVTCLATIQLYEDVGAGFVAIPEAIAHSRAHNTSTPEQHVVVSSIARDFAAGDIIRAYVWQAFGTVTAVSQANHSRLLITVQEGL